MLKRNLLKTRPTAILFYILPNTEMTNGGMKWNSSFVANSCKTMQYNFSSSIKKIVKIIELSILHSAISEFIVKREITKMNRNIFL